MSLATIVCGYLKLMRVVVQRVRRAEARVNSLVVGSISCGLLIYLGINNEDTVNQINKVANKIINFRIFNDEQNKMNHSIKDIKGELLIVSQFTLYADCKRGNRPSFLGAGNPKHAKKIYNAFVNYLINQNFKVQTGSFGSMMEINSINEGPATFILESNG